MWCRVSSVCVLSFIFCKYLSRCLGHIVPPPGPKGTRRTTKVSFPVFVKCPNFYLFLCKFISRAANEIFRDGRNLPVQIPERINIDQVRVGQKKPQWRGGGWNSEEERESQGALHVCRQQYGDCWRRVGGVHDKYEVWQGGFITSFLGMAWQFTWTRISATARQRGATLLKMSHSAPAETSPLTQLKCSALTILVGRLFVFPDIT